MVPIVFAPEVARGLIGSVFEAASGDAIWRQASFLADKLGAAIGVAGLTIIDDNLMMLPTGAGGFGSSPFDGEGLPSRRTVVVEKGVLKNYLLNTYSARKLGMKSTHNASRGLAGTPGIGCGNLYLEAGTLAPEVTLFGTLQEDPSESFTVRAPAAGQWADSLGPPGSARALAELDTGGWPA